MAWAAPAAGAARGRPARGVRIIAGRWGGRVIAAPKGRATRPTTDRVREAWMSALAPELPDARVLDLFAGSGALGLEALSRGAAHVTFVEKSGRAIDALKANLRALDAEAQADVVRADAETFVRRLGPGEYDIALADPPYEGGAAARIATHFAAVPFARWLWVEHGVRENLPALAGARTRRYGDTALTSIPAP